MLFMAKHFSWTALNLPPPSMQVGRRMAESMGNLSFSQFQLVLQVFFLMIKSILRSKFLASSGWRKDKCPHVPLEMVWCMRTVLPINIQIFQGSFSNWLLNRSLLACSHRRGRNPMIFKDLPFFPSVSSTPEPECKALSSIARCPLALWARKSMASKSCSIVFETQWCPEVFSASLGASRSWAGSSE